MLRIAYSPLSEESEGSVPAFTVIEQDRGSWKRTHDLPNEGITIFSGYNGENTLTFMNSYLGNNVTSVLVVHSVAGAPEKYESGLLFTDAPSISEKMLEKILERVAAQDPLLHG